uniref:fibrillin-1 n=1 Tax=Ciona intestinalis TaxID=7719 RepID=UPI00089DC4CC|nr:fibrillin-1 [Ciona intestinalis]|eukprot:XP_009858101.2 fibrillin-1 [Ciona intestinalis]
MHMQLHVVVLAALVCGFTGYVAGQGGGHLTRQSFVGMNNGWRTWNPLVGPNHHRYRGDRPRSARQGNERQRGSRNRRMGTVLTGRHVCHEKGSTFCCPGWTASTSGKTCSIPKCDEGNCGPRGVCVSPNRCMCQDGQTQMRCQREDAEDRRCNMRCMNGGECVDNQCRCPYGYTGPHCGQPICGPGCLNGGRCIAPGRCACVYGFTGMRCERDYRKGPCFHTRVNGTCKDEVPGVMCTKLFCCATVGEGWGHPCEECPARVGNCTKGRLPPLCTDIDECEIMPGLCEGGTCRNTDGSFACDCPEGYRADTNIHQCVDVNECASSDVCVYGNCINTDGGFICECPPDYKLSIDKTYCISDKPGRCYTAIESGMCARPLSELVRRTMCCCTPTGEETLGKCFAAVGEFPERCPAVGTPEFNRDCEGVTTGEVIPGGGLCELMGDRACAHGRCVNQPEQHTYFCECEAGYESADGGKQCVDVDECTQAGSAYPSVCGPHGTCLNTEGSYTCHCSRGFENDAGSMISCVDIDECTQDGLCENGACVNTRGSYVCNCNDGYRTSATQLECEDINECQEQQGLCDNGRCINSGGDFRCICNPGFFTSPDSRSCLDENECERDNMCANGECVNMDGRYKCVCNTGFHLLPSGQSCADINECHMNPCENGRCENSEGSFQCHCHRFQILDSTGTRCLLDQTSGECYRGVRNGQCRARNALTGGSSRSDCCCAVPGATSAWGDTCEPCPEVGEADYTVLCHDVQISNICELMVNPCENGDCLKMGNNQFRCICNKGFVVADDQMSCIDVDECSKNLCSNGACRNTPGSYTCTCNEGYLLRGDVCEDIDECVSNPCTNARCTNEPGAYRCVCEDGFILDTTGHVCYDVKVGRCWSSYANNQCSGNIGNRLLTKEECCNTIGVAWGNANCRPCTDFDLPCDHGYTLNVQTNECVNINECDFGLCQEDTTCVDLEGSFRCECPAGLTLRADGTSCTDVRVGICYMEVEDGVCSTTSADTILMTKHQCCCTVGHGWGSPCEICPQAGTDARTKLCLPANQRVITLNECILFPNLCVDGECLNTDSSFTCNCNQGYTLDESGKNCTDIDECGISPGLCGNGQCVNVGGDFRCDCDEGYEDSQTLKVCTDIDECSIPGHCTGGTCFNTEGSYECVCPDGRSLGPDGTKCIDVDECALRPNLCEPNGRCENMLGYYMCICDVGYIPTPDARDCVNIDECLDNNGGCHMGCTDTIGSYECSCDDGFVLAFDGHTCADRDECMEQMNRCDGGTCENTDGAFRCVCFDGFMATADLQFCEDIDECAMNANVCMHGKCHNTRGSYTCNCEPGYCVPQGQMICVDEDECEMSKHNCHVNADCNNTEGGYNCRCIPGFHGDGFMCHDDDECAMGTHMCHEFATCTNKHGSYECNCQDGYHGDGFSCSDNDDCVEDDTLCGPHGQCMNIEGSFECNCPMGFVTTEDRKACKDIDECSFEGICVNGRCHNVPGTFRCVCLEGYEKDDQGANCTDVDECSDLANCINGMCVNTDGAYECQCPEGFQSNPTGIGCVDTRVGNCFNSAEGDDLAPICTGQIGTSVTRGTCCCISNAGAWGNPCELCPIINSTEYHTLCPGGPGFRTNPITVLLEDINECVEVPGVCRGGKCINGFGTFVCECSMGYQLNPATKTCEDIDECEGDSDDNDYDVCGAGQCLNTVGGYNCQCPEGYKSIMGGRKCEDIRERSCHRNYNATTEECSGSLQFDLTKKKCCCFGNIGQGWNNPCEACPTPGTDAFTSVCGSENIIRTNDMCSQIANLCENGLCISVDSGFTCECSRGYHFNDELIQCEDINECVDEDLCFADSVCTNMPGSYVCSCMEGFVFDEISETCVDIDECNLSGTCTNGDCSNTRGGFVCDCNQGFHPINDDKACEDVNECDRDPCGRGVCQNVFGSFTCTCDNGYRISDNGDCVDKNECDEEGQCNNGFCDNTPGGFACDCNEGYSVTPDGRVCIDTDECTEDPLVCGIGTCQNMDGSFKCYCPDGYNSDNGAACNDVNECDVGDKCVNGACINTPGGFECDCPDEHVVSSNKKTCIDQRRAHCYETISQGTCANPGNTAVTISSCCCRCGGGGWGTATSDCEACPANGTQEFANICPQGCGFTPNGIDLNECDENNPCVNGRCVNQPGSFRCECTNGFTLDASGVVCVDVNECVSGASPCGNGTCTNTEGAFECACDDGFYNGPAMTCLDVNECKPGLNNNCAFRCVNDIGSFHCACPDGYELREDGNTCKDTDECASPDLNDCTENGMTCKNMIGFFVCHCQPGYRTSSTGTCVDDNECDVANVCNNGVCINLDGTYRCDCNEGYMYDEEHKMCLDTRQGLCYAQVHQRMCEVTSTTGLPFTKAECCCNRGKGWGEDCEACPVYGTTAFVQLCPHGAGYKPTGEDIDDCRVTPGLCAHGTCINTLGAFRCACSHGYEVTRSNKVCMDINECLAPTNPCSFDCRNTEGSYECICPKGYQIDADNSACVDLNECATKRHNCQYLCINTVGSFKCECPHGFTQEGAQCVDKNECIDMPGICGPRGVCRNDPGGYHCECPRGYRRDDMGQACMDVDECGGQQSSCAGSCQNIPGSFRCLCSRGFRPTMYGRGCQDVNECAHSPCSQGQSCSNRVGSFQCGCPSGLAKMRGGCGDVDECQMGGGSCNFGCRNSYGGFSCSCRGGFFRMGSGHCMSGHFEQRVPRFPQFPQFGGYGGPQMGMPPNGGFQGAMRPKDSVCYACMPGGDTRRRHKRSADGGRFIEVSNRHGRGTVNTSYPLEVHLNRATLTRRTPILELQPSLKQLRNNVRYRIVSGNDDRKFRLNPRGSSSVLHFTEEGLQQDLAGVASELTIRGSTTLSKDEVKQVALDSDLLEKAIEDILEFHVQIHVNQP